MTTETTTTDRVSSPRLVAGLLLLGHERKLPEWRHVRTFGIYLDLEFDSLADLEAWRVVLGDARVEVYQSRHATTLFDYRGWTTELSAKVTSTTPAVLPAESVAVLEQIANPAPAAEAQAIVDGLNGFITSGVWDLDRAQSWALQQPQVMTCRDFEVKLHDGTVIVFNVDVQRWEFATPPGPVSS